MHELAGIGDRADQRIGRGGQDPQLGDLVR
jgi:hypothetical protein